MLSLPSRVKTNFLPLGFFLNSILRRPRLPSSSSVAALSTELEPSPKLSPSIHDCNITAISEESCLLFFSQCKSTPLKHGACIHSIIVKLALEGNIVLFNKLLSFYSKHGQLDHARRLFYEMALRDIVSWTAIISACVQSGNDEEALHFYQAMLLDGLVPNHFTLSSILRCAASRKSSDLGRSLHALILKRGLESNFVLSSGLLDFYSKCDLFDDACHVFDLMGDRDTVSWTMMISASVKAEDWNKALSQYTDMLRDGVFPNEFTFTKLLTACSNLGNHTGQVVHAHVILMGINLNIVLKTAIVDMYSKCNNMIDAEKSLLLTSESDVMLWTAIISGYARAGDCSKAVLSFQEAQKAAAFSPNSFTYSTLLNASSLASLPELGRLFHCLVVKVGLEHDASVGNAIVDLYSKWSPQLEDAVNAFEAISSPNVVSWTALIAGFVGHGEDRGAMEALVEMQATGVKPGSFTLSTILTGLSTAEAWGHLQKLHAIVLKTNSNTWDITVGNSLVDAYAKLSKPRDAYRVFGDMQHRDTYTYTSLAKAFNQTGMHGEVLLLIAPLRTELGGMDGFSLASFLSAAAGLPTAECGKQLHCYAVKSGLDVVLSVSNGLVDMYGKSGNIDDARAEFATIQQPNVVSWNGLMSGLASNGRFPEVLSTFEDMRMAGANPDCVTFLIVLYACSHGGLVDLGMDYFNSMDEQFGVVPEEDHYVCLVDMLGRAGRLEEAAAAIGSMPQRPGVLIYKTLLGCCRLYGNMGMGEWAARQAMELDPLDSAIFMQLAGLYDDAGRMELGEQTRRMMRMRRASKSPGRSWM
ncbi:hypothetical protein HPP92_010809 [Vanilla planifolia]|uniref:Pentatricopeptide repeat-containing protein n=1 Tax=Vanilla planifolia TaxID=51239 RepID=A0A835V1S6_VANPL|nr:hypothetical protein HPP92_010809 [Vanilla planifolia]